MENCLARTKESHFGSNLSTILGNMTLDGLQKQLYDLQGEKIIDYYNGYCIRFADDTLITARTENDAEKFKKELIKFIAKRGLKISESKTKIVNIKNGFDFLSRHYCKIDGVIRCIPSDKAVKNFEKEVENLVEECIKNYPDFSIKYNDENKKQLELNNQDIKTIIAQINPITEDIYPENKYPMLKYLD